MNKLKKIFIVFLGGTDTAFNIFIPIAIALLFINSLYLSETNSAIILVAGIVSSIYRAIKIWIK